ncbi:hypothetical protein, partial [Cupriavidus basilensis]|uniref:hypothetical protein n=1 Tax=Cupriavidus basilensis TaxID=68895 RepID=UPI00283C4E4A
AKRPKSSASAIKRPHLSVVCLLKNLPRFALLTASLRLLQQRNETIKNYLRFINTFLIFSCSGWIRYALFSPFQPSPATFARLPCSCVLYCGRGRILSCRHGAGKSFLENLADTEKEPHKAQLSIEPRG